MQDWYEVGSLDDIPRRGARCVMSPEGRIAVFRTIDDQVFATEDRCPHKGGPLSQGIVHGTVVTCPLHGMVLSLERGTALGADTGKVKTIPVRIEGDRLFIQLAAHQGQAA